MKRYFEIILLITILVINHNLTANDQVQAFFYPYTISIAEAQKHNYKDLGDLLSLFPSIWTRDIGLTGQFLPYRFRGISENKVTLLLDGQPISEPWSDQTNLNLIPVEMIEKIEIYSSLNPFGLTSIGGVVDIDTKDIVTKRPYTNFAYRWGTNRFSDLDITFGQVVYPKLRMLSGVSMKYFGDPLYTETSKDQKIRSRLVWQPFLDWECRYDVLHTVSELDLAYSFAIPNDTTLILNPHHKLIRYDHNLGAQGNLLGIHTHFHAGFSGTKFEYRDQDFKPSIRYPVHSTTFSIGQDFRLLSFPFTWGMSSEKNQIDFPENKKFSSTFFHGFSQVTIPILDNFILMHQLHGHIPSDKKIRILSGHQLSWIPSTTASFWVAYSEALRDPALGERFGCPFHPIFPATDDFAYVIPDSLRFVPNDGLKPEASQTFEVGFQWGGNDVLQAKCRGFVTRIRDILDPIRTDHSCQYINQGENFHRGIETEIDLHFLQSLSSHLTLTYLKATDQDSANLYERPNLWGCGSVNWEHDLFQNDLHVNLLLSGRFWTDSWGLWNTLSEDISQMYLDPAFYLDFKISLTFLKQVAVSFALDNILNAERAIVAGYLLPARANRFSISWQLSD